MVVSPRGKKESQSSKPKKPPHCWERGRKSPETESKKEGGEFISLSSEQFQGKLKYTKATFRIS